MKEMNESERRELRTTLLSWYARHHRKLPWRETRDPYRIWISEVMLQQTQVKTVIPYYERFLSRFPTPGALAEADLQEVLKEWEGLGYYARARNLHRAMGRVMTRHDGKIPDDRDAFLALPGVGPYIAAAVLSIAFDRPLAVVDGNVKRLLARLLMMVEPVNDGRGHAVFQKAADRLLDVEAPAAFNQAMMEMGAVVCTPRDPGCAACPMKGFCRAFQAGRVGEFPVRMKKRAVPTHRVAVGVIEKNGRYLITRRKPDGLLGGLWEFPGGKIRDGETAADACVREILEETGLDVMVASKIAEVRHAYTHFKIRMSVFLCRYRSGRVRLSGPVDHRWIGLSELDAYPFPKANHKFIPALKSLA